MEIMILLFSGIILAINISIYKLMRQIEWRNAQAIEMLLSREKERSKD